MTDIIIIAGPNGAGKTTAAPVILPTTLGITEFVNADTIALADIASLRLIASGRTEFEANIYDRETWEKIIGEYGE